MVDGSDGLSFAVQADELDHDASAFDRLAENVDGVIARLSYPTSAHALVGPELGPAQAGFEDLWQRCSRDLTDLASSARQLAATVRAAADIYRSTDDAVASDSRKLARGL